MIVDYWAKPRRQPPIALLFFAVELLRSIQIRQVIIPLVIVIINFGSYLPWIVLLAGFLVVVLGALRWWFFTFYIEGSELKVSSGFLDRKRLVIPLERIQSVSTKETLLHRMLNTVEVAVDTAGGFSAELTLNCIRVQEVAGLRQIVGDGHRQASLGVTDGFVEQPLPPKSDQLLLKYGLSELMRVAFGRGSFIGLAIVAPFTFIFYQSVERFDLRLEDWVGERLGFVREISWIELSAVEVIGLTVLGLVLIVLLGVVSQVVVTAYLDWALTLVYSEGQLQREGGLINRETLSSKIIKIQSLYRSVTPLGALLGVANVRLAVIGGGDLIVPVLGQVKLSELRNLVLGEGGVVQDLIPDQGLSKWYIFYRFRLGLFIASGFCALLVMISAISETRPDLDLLLLAMVGALLMVLFNTAVAWRRWSNFRWGVVGERLVVSDKVISHEMTECLQVKTQSVVLRQSPFQARHDLGSVDVVVADGEVIHIPMVSMEQARRLRDQLIYKVESDLKPWM